MQLFWSSRYLIHEKLVAIEMVGKDWSKLSPKGAKPKKPPLERDSPEVGYRGEIRERLVRNLCSPPQTMYQFAHKSGTKKLGNPSCFPVDAERFNLSARADRHGPYAS